MRMKTLLGNLTKPNPTVLPYYLQLYLNNVEHVFATIHTANVLLLRGFIKTMKRDPKSPTSRLCRLCRLCRKERICLKWTKIVDIQLFKVRVKAVVVGWSEHNGTDAWGENITTIILVIIVSIIVIIVSIIVIFDRLIWPAPWNIWFEIYMIMNNWEYPSRSTPSSLNKLIENTNLIRAPCFGEFSNFAFQKLRDRGCQLVLRVTLDRAGRRKSRAKRPQLGQIRAN